MRGEHLEFVTMFEEQFELEFRIRGVVLRPTGCEGLAVFGHGMRVDGEQHQKVMSAEGGYQGTFRQLQADGDRPPAEALAEHAGPSADGLGCVCQQTGFPGIRTRDLQTHSV